MQMWTKHADKHNCERCFLIILNELTASLSIFTLSTRGIYIVDGVYSHAEVSALT